MSFLYVTESGATVSIGDNYVNVKYSSDMNKKIPIETLESISIFGRVQITTQCIEECLKRGIPISYYSSLGSYFGKLESIGHTHVERQRKQAQLYQSDFALEFAKRVLRAKIKNQEVVLKRYSRHVNREDVLNEIKMMSISYDKISNGASIEQLMGYEGTAAKYYFKGLSKLINEEFRFNGRSRRPPKDEFNSMISLGYSIIMNEIYGKIQNKGLNPYFGFIHRDREKHPTLASDLLEEWRAVIVDSIVMSMMNGHEILKEDFQKDDVNGGIFLNKDAMKKFLLKIEAKERADMRYLEYVDKPVSFRKAIEYQINQLVKAIEQEDATLYMPVRIR